MAARDVVSLLGGPNYAVELGRLDGKTFNRAIVKHVLPGPGFNLDQLNSLFAQNGLTQTDMIALSGLRSSCFFPTQHRRVYSPYPCIFAVTFILILMGSSSSILQSSRLLGERSILEVTT
uniref:Plant heme peroxidase family profile domain-containing protein n=1 Tax=Arundo donax TaxID=35708 RepID=A0A0A9DIW1_ARUDO